MFLFTLQYKATYENVILVGSGTYGSVYYVRYDGGDGPGVGDDGEDGDYGDDGGGDYEYGGYSINDDDHME